MTGSKAGRAAQAAEERPRSPMQRRPWAPTSRWLAPPARGPRL